MSTARRRKFAVGRIFFTATATLVAIVATYFFRDLLNNSSDTIGLIATIFSILAGVLITIISVLGDPSMLIDPSWRQNYLAAQETQRRLHRKTDVFILYVLLLASALVFHLVPDEKSEAYAPFQAATFFLTCMSFLFSLQLPYDLMGIQKERMRRAVQQKKNADGSGKP